MASTDTTARPEKTNDPIPKGTPRAEVMIATQRTGQEAFWPTPEGAHAKPKDFAIWPVSAPLPARGHPIADILVAALIVLVVALSAGLYISGALTTPHHAKPFSPTNPFATG